MSICPEESNFKRQVILVDVKLTITQAIHLKNDKIKILMESLQQLQSYINLMMNTIQKTS
jgi:hypothetical protein